MRSLTREDRVLLALVGAAVAVPVLARGGFTDGSRALFVALAGAALTAAFWIEDARAPRLVRLPAVALLVALALLTALSAAWSPADLDDVVRWALVLAGYAAVVVASAVLVMRAGPTPGLAVLAAVAAVAGLTGLVGAGLRELPWAERIGGSWRPGGTFEYAPALALLQVSALPALLTGMLRGRREIASLAAGGAAVAGAVLALADSRLQLALAAAAVLAALAALREEGGLRRLAALLVVPAGAGALAHAVAGGTVSPSDTGGDAARLAVLLALPPLGAIGWALARARTEGPSAAPAPGRRSLAPAAGAVAALALVAILLAARGGPEGERGIEPRGGVLHGRSDTWSAAAEAAADEAPFGAGAEAFVLASHDEQGEDVVLYAHNLPLEASVELGIPGLALILALYGACAMALWRTRGEGRAAVAGPAVAAFLAANLFDWPWHLAGAGAVWALALGVVLAPAGASGARAGRASD